jgi:hypothetical protein
MIVALANMRTLSIRAGRLSLRNLESLITALVLPVILMLMFVYLFGGAISGTLRHPRRLANRARARQSLLCQRRLRSAPKRRSRCEPAATES